MLKRTRLLIRRRPGRADPPLWQHDLFHGDHKPYDPEEIELFRKTILAAKQQRE